MTRRDKTPLWANRSPSTLRTSVDSKKPLIIYLHCPSDQVTDVGCSRVFYDRRVSQEVPGDSIGDEFNFHITGGNDEQGFLMKQGVLLLYHMRLLLANDHSCFRPRCTGERRRKSVSGCIVGSNVAVLSCLIVKQGEQEIRGPTDTVLPKRLGPKRATKVRRFFNLKEDVRREVTNKRKERSYTPRRMSNILLAVHSPRVVLTTVRPFSSLMRPPNPTPCDSHPGSNAAATSAHSKADASTTKRPKGRSKRPASPSVSQTESRSSPPSKRRTRSKQLIPIPLFSCFQLQVVGAETLLVRPGPHK